MSESAFVVAVPEAEACVGELRKRFDASSELGVPAHVTILFPFMARKAITTAVLDRARAALAPVRSFAFSLSDVGRFPDTAYLAPEPSAPFIALTNALAGEFPQTPPFRGEHACVIPHLTVAHGSAGDAAIAAIELEARVRSLGPVRGYCSSVVLLENSSGRWREMHVFALADADA